MSKAKINIDRKLVVSSNTDNLYLIRNFITTTGRDRGLDKEYIGKIVLAVDEACTNIIKHAYSYSPDGEIIIEIKTDKKKFIISITDKGNHFDPHLIPEPDIKKLQKAKQRGGLGMFLMKKLMDKVEYTNLANNKNQVVLVKYLT